MLERSQRIQSVVEEQKLAVVVHMLCNHRRLHSFEPIAVAALVDLVAELLAAILGIVAEHKQLLEHMHIAPGRYLSLEQVSLQ